MALSEAEKALDSLYENDGKMLKTMEADHKRMDAEIAGLRMKVEEVSLGMAKHHDATRRDADLFIASVESDIKKSTDTTTRLVSSFEVMRKKQLQDRNSIVQFSNFENEQRKVNEQYDNLFKTLASSVKTHNELLRVHTTELTKKPKEIIREVKMPEVFVDVDSIKVMDVKQKEYDRKLLDLEKKLASIKIPIPKKGSDWTVKRISKFYNFRTRVSENDSREDYLSKKIVAGSGISVTELNDGGVRTLSIAASGSATFDSLAVTNAFTVTNGPSVFNEGGGDFNFRIEGENDANLFHTDASADQIIIGTATALQTSKVYLEYTNTATSGAPYGLFAGLAFVPTSASSAIVGALGFSIQSSGSQNMTGQLKGIDAVVEHDGTGSLNQMLGANFFVKKSNTGDVTVMYGANFSIGNTNSTGSVILGVGSQFAPPTGPGAIANAAGAYILNQGRSGVTNSFGIYIDAQSGSSSINAALAIVGGVVIFNNGQDAVSDFTVLGDTDANLLFVDVSADLVNVGKFKHNGSTLGFYGATPVAKSSAYTPTNVTTDRAYDANATTIDEVADVLGTLIADLQLMGLIG